MAPTSKTKVSYRSKIDEIYNQQQIGTVYDLYQHNAVQHLPWGDLYGREAIIREYTNLLAAFPDLSYRSLGSICIEKSNQQVKLMEHYEWSGKHTGFSFYIPPSSKIVTVSGLRVLRCHNGRVLEEWNQDDRLNLIRQLKMEPVEIIRRMKASSSVDFTWEITPGEIEHSFGQITPETWPQWEEGKLNSETLLETLISKVWNWRLLGSIDELFSRECHFSLSGGASCENIDAYKADVLNRLAAFSDLTMLSDDNFWEHQPEGFIDSALRWTLIGTHDGYSSYGAPSGVRICIPGLSLIRIKNNRIVNLVERFGELALHFKIDHAQANGTGKQDIDRTFDESENEKHG